jgi:hypothetical protein
MFRKFDMSNRELPVTSSSAAFGKRNRGCLFLLDHLAEFATLAWYLVADGNLVDDAFLRSIPQLEQIPFDDDVPGRTCEWVRDIIISQAIAVLAEARQREHADHVAMSMFPEDLPDLCRLAFMLRGAVIKEEEDVARLIAVARS